MLVAVCPGCGARYRVPATAAGKRTTCKRCGQAFRISDTSAASVPTVPPAASPADSERVRLSDLESLSAGEVVAPPTGPAQAPPLGAVPAWGGAGVSLNARHEAAVTPPAAGAYKAYVRDVVRSLAFPIHGGNLVTFAIVCLVVGGASLFAGLAIVCILTLIAALILHGWYLSFQLNVVLGAAAGEDELPSLSLTGGWVDDILRPFVRMLAAKVMTRVPAAVLLVTATRHYGADFADLVGPGLLFLFGDMRLLLGFPDGEVQVVAGGLLVIGLFLWPMFVLIVAAGSMLDLRRLDLIVETVGRALPAYLIAAVIVWLNAAVSFVAGVAIMAAGLAQVMTKGADVSWLLALPLVVAVVDVFTTIVAMRAIGLFYHHFKHKFAWSWG